MDSSLTVLTATTILPCGDANVALYLQPWIELVTASDRKHQSASNKRHSVEIITRRVQGGSGLSTGPFYLPLKVVHK